MDWSKTKTIFILTFFILNFFLAYHLYEKRSSNQLDVIAEESIEQQLEQEKISYVELPKDIERVPYVSARSHTFTNEEARSLSGQQVNIINGTTLQAVFNDAIPLNEVNLDYQLKQILHQSILNGERYSFWQYDKKQGLVIFFQRYNDRYLYNNKGSIKFNLNEKQEIISYEQTMLEKFERYEKKEEILPALKAIETLYRKNYLSSGDRVTSIDLGYFGLVQFSTSQVLTPTWHVKVNNAKDLYVNAFEGQVITDDQQILE